MTHNMTYEAAARALMAIYVEWPDAIPEGWEEQGKEALWMAIKMMMGTEGKNYCSVCKSYTVEKQKPGKYVCLKCGARSAYKTIIDDDGADMLPKSGCGSGLEEEDIEQDKLRRCGCGGYGKLYRAYDGTWCVQCDCGVSTLHGSADEATETWNRAMGGERG
jgi:hypothetical protein